MALPSQRPLRTENRRRSPVFLLPENRAKGLRLALAAILGAIIFHIVLFGLFWAFDVGMTFDTASTVVEHQIPIVVDTDPDTPEDDDIPVEPPEPETIEHQEIDPPDIIDLDLKDVIITPEPTSISMPDVKLPEPGGQDPQSPIDLTQILKDSTPPPLESAFVTDNTVVINAPVMDLTDPPELEPGTGTTGDTDLIGNESLQRLLNMPAGSIGEGDVARLQADLLFEYNKAELKQSAHIGLLMLAALMEKNPQTRFIIEGHTDTYGTDAYNRKLSFQRAESVRNWLKGNGINLNRVYIRARAADNPISSTQGSREQQAPNRRVEIHMRKPTEALPQGSVPATETWDDFAAKAIDGIPQKTSPSPSARNQQAPPPQPAPKTVTTGAELIDEDLQPQRAEIVD